MHDLDGYWGEKVSENCTGEMLGDERTHGSYHLHRKKHGSSMGDNGCCQHLV